MAKYMDLNEMLRQARENEAGSGDSSGAKKGRKKRNIFKFATKEKLEKIVRGKSVVSGWNKTNYIKIKPVLPKTSAKKGKNKAVDHNEFIEEAKTAYARIARKVINRGRPVVIVPHTPIAVYDEDKDGQSYIKYYHIPGYREYSIRYYFPKGTRILVEDEKDPKNLKKIEKIRDLGVDYYVDCFASKRFALSLKDEKITAKLQNYVKNKVNNTKNELNTAISAHRPRLNAQKAVNFVKVALPFSLAVLPAGLATSFVISKYEQNTIAFNQMNAEIANAEATENARASFENAIQNIDGSKWLNARENAESVAQQAVEQYQIDHPNDIEGAQSLLSQVYASAMQEELGLNSKQYQMLNELYQPLADACNENIDQWIAEGWASLGYSGALDAIEKNPELFDAYLNNEEWAVTAWNSMLESVSVYYLDAGIFDVIKAQASDYATQNIFAQGASIDVAVSDFVMANPELAIVGAIGSLGLGVAMYCASRKAMNVVCQNTNTAESSVESSANADETSRNL